MEGASRQSKTAEPRLPRRTLFDSLPLNDPRNLYCAINDLSNEASVETFFVVRLLKELGYSDSQIKTKKSISDIVLTLGPKRVKYKPDYVLKLGRLPRWVLDAKSTDEQLDRWESKCSGYCLELNRQSGRGNPVQYFVLTNGLETRLYKWDEATPILELEFKDFIPGNPKYERFRKALSAETIGKSDPTRATLSLDFRFERPTPELARRIFAQCHRAIWKSEGYGPAPAFREFVKVMFVKLWCDKKLRDDASVAKLLAEGRLSTKLPATSLGFSVQWIESREHETENPLSDILFKTLRDNIEQEIEFRKKKRIFAKDEQINLRPGTVKSVVRRLQHYDMFGIDEDLNGRLFETFLSATMRGRELGQFFTPRSIVKLMTRLARLNAAPDKIETVIDACCGSGGFLIEALADMRNKVRENQSLSLEEKRRLLDRLSNDCIYGVDFGKDPPLARIARINMYLHGDGGSRIYYADALDKDLKPIKGEDAEIIQNQEELRQAMLSGLGFDVALTNPPFSMTKQLSAENEAEVLKQYDLARVQAGSSKLRSSLRSSAMFIERYRDVLRPGGRLLTVIDDTLLSSKKFSYVRDFIRENFIVRAIVSLPGDAFRRSGSRVKTSVLHLERKANTSDTQPAAFGAFSEHLGVDDLTPRASDVQIREAREKAEVEIDRIARDFQLYLDGDKGVLSVPPSRLVDRLDLKYCAAQQGRLVPKWRREGIEVKKLHTVVDLVSDDVVPSQHLNTEFRVLRVTYEGYCQVQFVRRGSEIKPEKMTSVKPGDLVFSVIRATDGAVAVVPPEMDGCVVSGSYIVMRCSSLEDAVYLWSVLRTHEIRADLQSPSTGTGRYTTDWSDAKEVWIPWLEKHKRGAVAKGFLDAWALARQKEQLEKQSLDVIYLLGLESEESKHRFSASKAPK